MSRYNSLFDLWMDVHWRYVLILSFRVDQWDSSKFTVKLIVLCVCMIFFIFYCVYFSLASIRLRRVNTLDGGSLFATEPYQSSSRPTKTWLVCKLDKDLTVGWTEPAAILMANSWPGSDVLSCQQTCFRLTVHCLQDFNDVDKAIWCSEIQGIRARGQRRAWVLAAFLWINCLFRIEQV